MGPAGTARCVGRRWSTQKLRAACEEKGNELLRLDTIDQARPIYSGSAPGRRYFRRLACAPVGLIYCGSPTSSAVALDCWDERTDAAAQESDRPVALRPE